jgi:hypothetical protein
MVLSPEVEELSLRVVQFEILGIAGLANFTKDSARLLLITRPCQGAHLPMCV